MYVGCIATANPPVPWPGINGYRYVHGYEKTSPRICMNVCDLNVQGFFKKYSSRTGTNM